MYKEIRKRVSLTTAMLLTFSYISFGPVTLKPVEGSTRTNVVTEGLVGAWDFESGTDDGVGDNHGVIIGDAEVVDGAERGGKVLKLNGQKNNHMTIPLNINTSEKDMTVSMWYKADEDALSSISGASSARVLFQQEGAGRGLLQIYKESRKMGSYATAQIQEASNDVKLGQWQHVVLTMSTGSSINLYLDGDIEVTFNAVNLANEASRGFRVGEHKTGDNSPFKGLIDDIKIYDRPLSEEEVRTLFQNESPVEVPKESEITTIAAINVTTQVGTPPQLPEKVTVTYDDTTTEELGVVWGEIPETKYLEIGSFIVEGDVAGTEIKAVANVTVVVAKEINLDVNGDQKVNVGDLGIVARYFGYSKVENPDVWETMQHADVDGNEAIELLDLILVAREILKK